MKQILAVTLLMLISVYAFATKSDCERQRVDCIGECGRMVDANGDGFCDHGDLSLPQAEPIKYLLIEVLSVTLGLYFTSLLLVKNKLYRKITHRKIWNYFLLITFLTAALLGLLLVVFINYQIKTDFYLTYLALHVDFGIAMSIVGLIHFMWHWNYYFKKKKN